jgi:choline kinase
MSCAGAGSRLGLGCTKALVQVCGRPLIHWNLAMIAPDINVVCVVGYQAEEVIETVLKIRPDITFAFNRNYATTGTAASLVLGARGVVGDIVSLDGDLLVHPQDFAKFLAAPTNTIGVCEPLSSDPVLVECEVQDGAFLAHSFTRDTTDSLQFEWTGLVKVAAKTLQDAAKHEKATGHVYQMIENLVPLNAHTIRCREIDTPRDHVQAEAWLEPIQNEWGPSYEFA